jgi:N-acetylmuramoyl-L-alanine amidase
VRLEVSRPIVANMFMLDEPYRAIVDVPDLDFTFAPPPRRAAGIVSDYRYGRFESGRSRLVIDLTAAASIRDATFTAPASGRPGVLKFDLVRVAPADFVAMRGTSEPLPSPPAAGLRTGRHEETAPSPPPGSSLPGRPVVVIDPGHGGIDGGSVGAGTVLEKNVTLAVAREVRALLQQGRRLDVRLTRDGDTFISLDQRVKVSRQLRADLFVSIHADSLAEKDLAPAVRGATVYVLADRASDDRAQRLADKENAADIVAGLSAVPASAEDQVRSILLDLVQRETADYAATFRSLLVSNMRGKLPLAKDPQRAAAFKVLRQSEVPAVLVELGYMSNAEDLARLSKAEGQRQLAAAIAASINTYFARRDAALGTSGPGAGAEQARR